MLFGIIGGDRRQEELLALLRRDGYTAAACGVAGEMDWDAAVAAEVVILPLPLCKEGDTLNIEGPRRGAGALFRQLRRDQLILAGQVKPAQAALAAELDLKLVDYFRREELTVANAAATAEGTVQVILERLERSLLGSQCLVLCFVPFLVIFTIIFQKFSRHVHRTVNNARTDVNESDCLSEMPDEWRSVPAFYLRSTGEPAGPVSRRPR